MEFHKEMTVREDVRIADSSSSFLNNEFNDVWEDEMNENEENVS